MKVEKVETIFLNREEKKSLSIVVQLLNSIYCQLTFGTKTQILCGDTIDNLDAILNNCKTEEESCSPQVQ